MIVQCRPIIDDEIIKFQFIQDLNNNYRRGILICISRPERNLPSYGINVLAIKPLFRLSVYFEPKKEIGNDNIEKTNLIKINMILNNKKENFIKICIKFKEEGNYLIKLKCLNKQEYFIFFVKVLENKNEKCISKIFENMELEEIKILNLFKYGIEIYASKTKKNFKEEELFITGEMSYEDEISFEKGICFNSKLAPLIDNGNYFFELNNEGNILEKIKEIKNNLINNLKLREIKKVCKNKFEELIDEKQQFLFLFNDEYYKINDCLVAEKLVEEN
uniref:Galectin n=1 Tax=Meloidogyne floridensis TaxID=298350 RepID=A0A915P0S5_9BILA